MTDEPDQRRWLTRGVVGVGSASLFSDSSHEMVTSLLPTFVVSTLGSGAGALGVIEGASDALTGVAKLAGGPLASDRDRRIRLASGGYLGTAVATAAIGLTTAVWQVACLRAFAWLSRGIRSPSRDMLLTELVDESAYGRAVGLERAGDNAGAVIGPLLAASLVAVLGIRHLILLAIIPGLLAAVAITVAGREAQRTLREPAGRRTLSLRLGELRAAGLLPVLAPVALFEFGNLASTLLILRATEVLTGPERSVTAATSIAVLLYAAHNVAASASAYGGGHLADRIGARTVFALGGAAYVIGYALFALDAGGWPLLLGAFLLAGVGIGCAETAETTVVARGLPAQLRSNGLGVLGLTQAIGDISATLVGGLLWAATSATVAFVYAGGWMLLSIAATAFISPRHPPTGH